MLIAMRPDMLSHILGFVIGVILGGIIFQIGSSVWEMIADELALLGIARSFKKDFIGHYGEVMLRWVVSMNFRILTARSLGAPRLAVFRAIRKLVFRLWDVLPDSCSGADCQGRGKRGNENLISIRIGDGVGRIPLCDDCHVRAGLTRRYEDPPAKDEPDQ